MVPESHLVWGLGLGGGGLFKKNTVIWRVGMEGDEEGGTAGI